MLFFFFFGFFIWVDGGPLPSNAAHGTQLYSAGQVRLFNARPETAVLLRLSGAGNHQGQIDCAWTCVCTHVCVYACVDPSELPILTMLQCEDGTWFSTHVKHASPTSFL